ncbi:unnamed protein product [Caenorhabditis sp. 36 PRJEB53466]|nr:unnamed protein product [Caenorhabditis sp. 36 PRJEB53466]
MKTGFVCDDRNALIEMLIGFIIASLRRKSEEMSVANVELAKLNKLDTGKLPEASVAFVKNDSGKTLARETIIKYTPSLAYAVVQELDPSIAGKDILVKNEDALQLKLITIETVKENRRLLPIAQQFHSVPDGRHAECHMTDVLATHSLGRFNLDLKKNVTIDSFELTDSWRDDAGFIVTDRNTYFQGTFDVKKLLPTLLPSSQTISAYAKTDFDAVADFDSTVCGFSRDAYLQLLLASNAAATAVFVAKSSGSVDGYIVGSGERINHLYAETIELAHALLKQYVLSLKLTTVTLFAANGVWECEPKAKREVHRRHTRAVPSLIKWAKIYALNMGVHIV